MIVQRTQPCLRIIEGVVIYPGLNGNIPNSLLENSSFKMEMELGYMKIIDKKQAPDRPIVDPSSSVTPNREHDDIIDKPDEDVIASVTGAAPKKAVELVKGILKIATVIKLLEIEKRNTVAHALNEQKEALLK